MFKKTGLYYMTTDLLLISLMAQKQQNFTCWGQSESVLGFN